MSKHFAARLDLTQSDNGYIASLVDLRFGPATEHAMRYAIRSMLLAAFCAAMLSAVSAPAHAGKFFFGADEHLHVIAETKLTNDGAPISLCYKTYTYFLLAGIYTTDTYVLCDGGASKRYWPMPSGAELTKYQEAGMIPQPLPAYKRDWFDYAIGYSIWILIAVIAIWSWFDKKRSATRRLQQVDLMKSTSRRIMARMVASTGAGAERGTAVAEDIYRQVFKEPLAPSDFSADLKWVRDEPHAFDGFVRAMGRKLDGNAKVLLIRAAAFIVMADGALDQSEEQALLQLAAGLGMSPKEATALVENLRNQSASTAAISPTA